MDTKIKELYKTLRNDTAAFMIYQDRSIIKKTYKNIAAIQEFVTWFLKKNPLGIEEEVYVMMCRDLLNSLKDMLEAAEQNDMVLMNDALAYGILEYLKMFCSPEEEEKESDAI